MKANQKFMEADNAVSPVIGVILMVAITVVLAAVVFVLVSDLGGGSGDSQPAMAWSVSQANAEASVTSADPGADWSEFQIRFDGTKTGEVGINENPQGTGTCTAASCATITAGDFVQLPSGAIGGGDKLSFCVDGTAGPLTATLRHIDSNSVAREFTFTSDVPSCA